MCVPLPLLVTKMQPYLGMANSCYKKECRIYDTDLFEMGSGKISLVPNVS